MVNGPMIAAAGSAIATLARTVVAMRSVTALPSGASGTVADSGYHGMPFDAGIAQPRMIIPSLLDTDLYKFTMMQVVLHHFPGAQVEYRFKCRNPASTSRRTSTRSSARSAALCALRFTPRRARLPAQLALLQERLRRPARPLPARRALHQRRRASPASPSEIDITIKGPWLHTILFEVPVLAIVSEVYYRNMHAAAGPRRRTPPARGEDRADQRGARPGIPHRRLRHAAALLARLAGRGAAHAEGRHRPASSSAPATCSSRWSTA